MFPRTGAHHSSHCFPKSLLLSVTGEVGGWIKDLERLKSKHLSEKELPGSCKSPLPYSPVEQGCFPHNSSQARKASRRHFKNLTCVPWGWGVQSPAYDSHSKILEMRAGVETSPASLRAGRAALGRVRLLGFCDIRMHAYF